MKALNENAYVKVNNVMAAPIFLIDNNPTVDTIQRMSSMELFKSAASLNMVNSKIIKIKLIIIQAKTAKIAGDLLDLFFNLIFPLKGHPLCWFWI